MHIQNFKFLLISMHKIENIKQKNIIISGIKRQKNDLGRKSSNKSSIKVRESKNPLYKQEEAL